MIETRPPEAGDAAAIAQLLDQLGYPTRIEAIPDRIAAILKEGGTVVVAVDVQGTVVGLASGAQHATMHAELRVAYITVMVVDVAMRGKGVGRTLVNAIEEWAVAIGCARLSVTSAEHRADAHAFYPKCGLPYTGRRFAKDLLWRSRTR